MNDPVPTAAATLADVKAKIENLGTGAVLGIQAEVKSFYEKHVPAFCAIGGMALGALLMLMKLKL